MRSKSTSQPTRGSSVPPPGVIPIPESLRQGLRESIQKSTPRTPVVGTQPPLSGCTFQPDEELTASDSGTPIVDLKESGLRDETE